MSDPQPVPGRKTPRRAEPLQPDNPTQGSDSESAQDAAPEPEEKKQETQSETALKNVREGYG